MKNNKVSPYVTVAIICGFITWVLVEVAALFDITETRISTMALYAGIGYLSISAAIEVVKSLLSDDSDYWARCKYDCIYDMFIGNMAYNAILWVLVLISKSGDYVIPF